jgi:8-oxo-dGTP pyrophosphatase MutT (NUDIX family)
MNHFFTTEQNINMFLDQLKTELELERPGLEAHLRLAPDFRIDELKTEQPPEHALESAVLIILYPHDGQLYTVVILRNEYDGAHSGQISLPGGKREKSDVDFKQTALREANEEIGIIPADLEVLGQLSRFYVRPSNYIVFPFIAYLPHRPEFHPDATEVQRIIEIDIFKDLTYNSIVNKVLMFKSNLKIKAPGFIVEKEFMWGATAMIFSELIQILNNVVFKVKQTRQG